MVNFLWDYNIMHGMYNIKLTMFCLGKFLKIEDCVGVFSYMCHLIFK